MEQWNNHQVNEYLIKLNKKRRFPLFERWTWKMALKDARNHWSRLFLFISAITIGIAALVAINAFNKNLREAINDQARGLLGADLEVDANSPFEEELIQLFDSVGGEQASEMSMASMVSFKTNTPGSRLIRLLAWEGDFPFYGDVEVVPENALELMRSGRYAMVDENLAVQYDVSSEDSVKVGKLHFKIAGVVKKIPGGGQLQATFTPSVYIDRQYIDSTGLVQFGSRINYKRFFKSENPVSLMETLEPTVRKYGHRMDDVEEQKEDLGEAVTNLYKFFNLLSFIALILGSIGVASSVFIYTREKYTDVAILRCLGASGNQAFILYLVQILIFGFIGSIIGALLGIAIQYLLPVFFGDLLPVEVELRVQWLPFAEGLLLGLFIAVIFSLLPLINLKYVPPLAVIRQSAVEKIRGNKYKLGLYILSVFFLYGFAYFQTGDWLISLGFIGGLLIALGGLMLLGKIVIWSAGRLIRHTRGFVKRQAFSNLFRPQNQTVTMVVVIGLGAFLLSTLEVVQGSIVGEIEALGGENSSNTILFDIQPYQAEPVKDLTRENELPINQFVPIVTIRIQEIHGKKVEEIKNDTTDNISNWAVSREYRVTYRDTLNSSEKLIKGEVQQTRNDSIFVTISEGMQDNLDVEIGDTIVFDVQGIPMTTYVGGVRSVEWPKDPPNFIFVFPTGVLEEAPQIFVLTTNVQDPVVGNKYQRELVAAFPNVSLIDLRLVLRTLNDFFEKVSFVIRFMALFSLLTGLIVLAGSVINSKFGRLKENVLLRTLGALQKQLVQLTLVEYGYLGAIAGATGIILSVGSGYLLAKFLFDIAFAVDVPKLLYIWLAITGVTVFIGWWNTRDITSQSPAASMRRG